MKILRVRIGSYGAVKDRDYSMDPKLNVVYGPNEAGKSSLRSFITGSLFQKTNVKYPEPKKSDCGSIDIEMSDGKRRTIERDGKKSIGCVDAECGIDGREYTSIYSMQPDDLRDTSGLEKGEIRNRFLTVPGGSDLPKVYENLKNERTAYVPDGRRSEKSRFSVLSRELTEAKEAVVGLQAREDGDGYFNDLSERKRELEKMISESDGRLKACGRSVQNAAADEVRQKTREQITKLERSEAELAYAGKYDPGMKVRYQTLVERREEAERKYSKEIEKTESARSALGGRDVSKILANEEAIEGLRYAGRQKREPASGHTAERTGKIPPLTFVGILLVVAGIAVITMQTVAGIAVMAAGAVVTVLSLRGRKAVPLTETEAPRSASEKELDRVASAVGISRIGFDADVAALCTLLDKAKALKTAESDLRESEAVKKDTDEKLSIFLSGFGGEEGFVKAMDDREALDKVKAQLEALRNGDTAPGAPEPVDRETADNEYRQALGENGDLKGEYGRICQALKDIEGDETVEEAITKRAIAENKVYAAAREWACLMLQQKILDEATEKAYSGHRPDVLRNADRFLSLMTDGRYGMDTSPETEGISVKDLRTGEVKNSKQWSTGLGDQVKLSLKLAVSLSLSKERPPVILDDVLLTSDSGRKKGACAAIAELSEDIQVIYFTCDRETRDLLVSFGASAEDL